MDERGPGSGQAFPVDFDHVVSCADGEAHFGRDVLRGLVKGIDKETERQRNRSSNWHWGTGVLGCAMWMDDPQLITALGACHNVCIVVTKQPRDRRWVEKDRLMRGIMEDVYGLAQEAYPELAEHAPSQGGKPLVVGPGIPNWHDGITPVRELGFRRSGNQLVPIVHAKVALLGEMRWTDEHPSGHIVDQLFFVPKRLWVGSANFTAASRRSLEMGLWTTEPKMIRAARRFLLDLISASEPWGTTHNDMTPELLPVAYDDAEILQYMREVRSLLDEDENEGC